MSESARGNMAGLNGNRRHPSTRTTQSFGVRGVKEVRGPVWSRSVGTARALAPPCHDYDEKPQIPAGMPSYLGQRLFITLDHIVYPTQKK
jgi:hypothetical protein